MSRKVQLKDAVNAEHRFSICEGIVVFIGFFSLYVATISENLSIAHDSIGYINNIDTNTDLFHPHHLLYNAFAKAWVLTCRVLGVGASSHFLVCMLNAVFGALTLWIVHRILRRRLHFNRLAAVIGTACPAFSFGFWFYSVCVEVYVIPIFFLSLCLYLLTSDNANTRTYALVGFTHGVAVLFHQVHVLFVSVVLSAIYLSAKNGSSLSSRSLFSYLAVFLLTVAGPYLAVILGVLRLSSIRDICFWITAYAHDTRLWQSLSFPTLIKAVLGFCRSVLGGHFVFRLSSFSEAVNSLLTGHYLEDEQFLVRNLSDILAYVLVVLSLAFALAVVMYMIRSLRNIRQVFRGRDRKFAILLITFLVPYSVFFFFFEPENVEFWIPQSLFFWLLFLLVWRNANSKERVASGDSILLRLACIPVLLLVINLVGSIYWLMDAKNDYYYEKSRTLANSSTRGDLIVIGMPWILRGYLDRYAQGEVLSLYSVRGGKGLDRVEVRSRIEKTLDAGSRVFILKEVVAAGAGGKSHRDRRHYGEEGTGYGELWASYRDRWVEKGEGIGAVYVLGKMAG